MSINAEPIMCEVTRHWKPMPALEPVYDIAGTIEMRVHSMTGFELFGGRLTMERVPEDEIAHPDMGNLLRIAPPDMQLASDALGELAADGSSHGWREARELFGLKDVAATLFKRENVAAVEGSETVRIGIDFLEELAEWGICEHAFETRAVRVRSVDGRPVKRFDFDGDTAVWELEPVDEFDYSPGEAYVADWLIDGETVDSRALGDGHSRLVALSGLSDFFKCELRVSFTGFNPNEVRADISAFCVKGA